MCMILPIGFIMMAVGFGNECNEKYKTADHVSMVFAGIYAAMIEIVYLSIMICQDMECWCTYFILVAVLSIIHFGKYCR